MCKKNILIKRKTKHTLPNIAKQTTTISNTPNLLIVIFKYIPFTLFQLDELCYLLAVIPCGIL